jgi:hypothetical protein
MFIFFTCLKKTNQKKGHPRHLVRNRRTPCAPRICLELENSLRSNRSSSLSANPLVLGLRDDGRVNIKKNTAKAIADS